jgi:hypothetical protein
MTELLRPLPAYAGAACSPGQVGVACSHMPLSDDERHATLAGPPHRTRRNHGQPVAVVPLAPHAGARFPVLMAGSSSEDQVRLESGQTEIKASDGQGQRRTDQLGVRKWQPVPGRPGGHPCQSRVVPAGCVPGATDGSMPVGSGSVPRSFPAPNRSAGNLFFVTTTRWPSGCAPAPSSTSSGGLGALLSWGCAPLFRPSPHLFSRTVYGGKAS